MEMDGSFAPFKKVLSLEGTMIHSDSEMGADSSCTFIDAQPLKLRR